MREVRGGLTSRCQTTEFVHATVAAPEFEVRFLKLLVSLLQLNRRFANKVAQNGLLRLEFGRQLELAKQVIRPADDQRHSNQRHPNDVPQIAKRHTPNTLEPLHDLDDAARATVN